MAKRVRSSQPEMIHCPYCGEDYSSTYKHCPFCDEVEQPVVEEDLDESGEGSRSRGGKRTRNARGRWGSQGRMKLLLRRRGSLGGRSPERLASGKENSTQEAIRVRYSRVDGYVLPSLQRPEDVVAARGSFPLAELLEVHAEPTEALDVAASTRCGRRSA